MARKPTVKSNETPEEFFDADDAPAVAPEPEVVETPRHNARALALAKHAGLSEAEANEMTPQELGSFLMADYTRTKRELESRQQQPAPQQTRQLEPEPVDPAWAWLDAKIKGDDGVEAPMYDQNLTGSVRSLREENKSLKGLLKKIEEDMTKREVREFRAGVDDAFESLGEKYQRFFGDLTIDEMQDGTKEWKWRQSILTAAALKQGDSISTVKRKVRAAAREMLSEFAEAEPKPKPKAPARVVEDDEDERTVPVNRLQNGRPRDENGRYLPGEAEWLFGSTGRPTSRTTPEFEGTDTERAVAAVAALQKQMTGQDFTRSSEIDRATLEGFLDG